MIQHSEVSLMWLDGEGGGAEYSKGTPLEEAIVLLLDKVAEEIESNLEDYAEGNRLNMWIADSSLDDIPLFSISIN